MKKLYISLACLLIVATIVFFSPRSTLAAVSLIDSGSTGSSNGTDITFTFAGSPAQNDVIILFGGHANRASTNLGAVNQGYTTATSTAILPPMVVQWKVMGASPDTQVIASSTKNIADGACYGYYILRGVDTSSPMDVNPVGARGTGAGPNNAAIVTASDNAWVLSLMSDDANDAVITFPAGYSNTINASGADTTSHSCAGATVTKTPAGSEDPGAYGSWGAAGNDWQGTSIAVRPQVVAAVANIPEMIIRSQTIIMGQVIIP